MNTDVKKRKSAWKASTERFRELTRTQSSGSRKDDYTLSIGSKNPLAYVVDWQLPDKSFSG